jgi:hypothetical protein
VDGCDGVGGFVFCEVSSGDVSGGDGLANKAAGAFNETAAQAVSVLERAQSQVNIKSSRQARQGVLTGSPKEGSGDPAAPPDASEARRRGARTKVVADCHLKLIEGILFL